MVEKKCETTSQGLLDKFICGAVVVICPAIIFANHKRNLSDVFHEVPCNTLFETCQLYSKIVVYHWLC